jgi:hypothetical protein
MWIVWMKKLKSVFFIVVKIGGARDGVGNYRLIVFESEVARRRQW